MSGKTPDSAARRPRRWSRLFQLALVLSVLYVVLQAFAPQTIGETARRKLQSDLQAHYDGYQVSIGRGHYDKAVGLTFDDIRIISPTLPQDSGTARTVPARLGVNTPKSKPKEIIRINRLTVVAKADPERLLHRSLPLDTQAIILDGVTANTWLAEDDQISLSKLWPLPKFGPEAPKMVIRQTRVNFFSDASSNRPLQCDLDLINIQNRKRKDGTTHRTINIRGNSVFADQLDAKIITAGDRIEIQSKVTGVQVDRSLLQRLPENARDSLAEIDALSIKGDASILASRQGDEPWIFEARTTIHDGRIEHPILPKPLSALRGIVSLSQEGIEVEASQANLGEAILRLSGGTSGYNWPCKTDLAISAKGLWLDESLASTLPPKARIIWDRLLPSGHIDFEARLQHDSEKWIPEATVTCNGVDIRYERFPYPVENVTGQIDIGSNSFSADTLTGRVGDNRMQCAFRIPIQRTSESKITFVMATDGPVPIDQTLLSALTPRGEPTSKLESFVRSLHPRGSVQVTSAALEVDSNKKLSKRIDLRVMNGHMRYEKFPYPLYNVSGTLLVDDDLVTLAGLRASNANAGTVRCDGTYQMPQKSLEGIEISPSELALQFHANDVPMDESLRTSLPAQSQQVWDSLAPSGTLDEISVALRQIGEKTPLGIDLYATQRDNPQITSQTLSLRPQSLPYRLDVTGGSVRFDGKTVTIESIRGRHDASNFSADGFCVENASERWELFLNLHSGCRLHPDAEFIAALPEQTRAAMRALQLRGPLNIRGQTKIAMPDATHAEPTLQWDLTLQLEGNRIADVGPVHSMRGEISIQGERDESVIRAFGEVRIDSMHVNDIQITGIRGPFSIEDDLLSLGSLARSPNPQVQNPLSAVRGNLFSGLIDLDGNVVLSNGNFDVDLNTYYAQLPTLLADFGHSEKNLSGTLSGQAHLQGNLGALDLLRGAGTARVSGANVYQLPLIVQILNLLRLEATEDVAFTDGQVRFSLYGDTATFHDIQMWGDLVALQGGGTLNRRRELDLTFNTRVSPQNTFTQLIRPLGATRYTLLTINVRGPLNAPQIERKALERVSETLEWLLPGMTDNQRR